jgi:hypothetical protein
MGQRSSGKVERYFTLENLRDEVTCNADDFFESVER